MQDDWFGHRDAFTFEPVGDKDEWVEWDYVLLNAFQTVEDWTNQDGLLAYEVDDFQDRVIVQAVRKINKFEAAKESITGGKNYKPRPGEYFVPETLLQDPENDSWPTMEEYIEGEIAKRAESAE